MRYTKYLFILVFIFISYHPGLLAQEEEEPILYFQMEPLDDSLFINIQLEIFIDPPDPKAEIIVDLRDPANQTVSIKGALYPFLAFTPEIRARIQTYPFKINLEEGVHYASVFTRVFERMRFSRIAGPPTLAQISPTVYFVNPFLQVFGGERFGVSIKKDIGASFGIGTPYSGVLESNMIEMNFHILGFFGGVYNAVDAITDLKTEENHNNIYVTSGVQIGYVIPFGNFFQVSYTSASKKFSNSQLGNYERKGAIVRKNDGTVKYSSKFVSGSYVNWELRYPFSFMGSTRGKFYVAQYLNEWHIGYTGRELSLAGSTFDLRIDVMPKSDIRQPQYLIDIMVQKIAEGWGFSALAFGPSAVITTLESGKLGFASVFANVRLKVGTSF